MCAFWGVSKSMHSTMSACCQVHVLWMISTFTFALSALKQAFLMLLQGVVRRSAVCRDCLVQGAMEVQGLCT